ncbi:unnamed protein product [Xylocopa violacea]|uniref:Uncharacterized protein n=1 Tax=Xylocopa violacea TaxID=135666 RepID=A0ABP1PD11_XYLVO
MKLLVALAVISSLSSSIVSGNEDLTNALAVHEAGIGELDIYEIFNSTDICRNETLILNFTNSLTVNRNFIVSPSIRCISVKIRDVIIREGAFDLVPSLQYLDLRENNIAPEELFSFGKLPNVKVLHLGNQNYRYMQNLVVRAEYPELVYLELRNAGINNIRTTSNNIFPKLSGNQISDFSLTRRNNLSSLRLDNNMIRLISEDYSGLNLKGLTNLLYLSVANNRISSITWGAFENMVNLRYLDLSSNSVPHYMYEMLQPLTSLEILILDKNSFTQIPNLPGLNLIELSLRFNNMTYLKNYALDMSRLKKLYLSENMITMVDVNAFQRVNLLEELHLDNNRLTNLIGGWCRLMPNLRYLDLSGNKFVSLESAIYSPRLPIKELHFERNPLAYINTSILEIIPKNMTIYLNVS